MDPLSITASTITVINAARFVSVTLYEFVSTLRNTDTRISALCNELSTLINFLEAVDRSLEECRGRPLSLASVGEDLWRQSALSLTDCKTTLDELEGLISRIKASTKHTSVFRRAKVAVDLTMYARDIAGFQEKIHKSNWALQTMLSAINVLSDLLSRERSLSLRGNATQETTLYELRRLKQSIKQSLNLAIHHGDLFPHTLEDPSDARVTHNLRNLAHTAQSFYSSASSTASTTHGINRALSRNVQSDAIMSGRGDLTLDKRDQIRQYLEQIRGAGTPKPLQRVPSTSAVSAELPFVVMPSAGEAGPSVSDISDENDDGDCEAEFELLFLSGLEEVAKESIRDQDFAKAETFLEKVIERRTGLASGDPHYVQLQIQLAICYFFQHKWRHAEPLITSIAKSKPHPDAVVCNLLHALALAYLSEYRFEKAIPLCKQALHGKRRLMRAADESRKSEYNETLALLATIYEIQGDPMYAEILRRTIPREFTYIHPFNQVDFISRHPTLLQKVFRIDTLSIWGQPQIVGRHVPVVSELRTAITPAKEKMEIKLPRIPQETLRTKLDLYEKFEADTRKEVISVPSSASDSDEADDEATSATNSDTGSRASSRPDQVPKRPFTHKIGQFLSAVRVGPNISPDDPTSPRSLESGYMPLRQRLGMNFWSKSDSNILDKKPRTRLRKSKSDESVNKSFSSILRGRRQIGFRVLHMTPIRTDKKEASAVTTQSEPRNYPKGFYSGLSPENCSCCDENTFVKPRVPAPTPQEMEDFSRTELPDDCVDPSRRLENLPKIATRNDECCAANVISQPIEHDGPKPAPEILVRRPKLRIIVPDSAKKPGKVPLVARYQQKYPWPLAVREAKAVNKAQSSTSIPRSPPVLPIPRLTTPSPKINTVVNELLHEYDAKAEYGLSIKRSNTTEVDDEETKGWPLATGGPEKLCVPTPYVTHEAPKIARPENSPKTQNSRTKPNVTPSAPISEPTAEDMETYNMSRVKKLDPLKRSDSSRSWHHGDEMGPQFRKSLNFSRSFNSAIKSYLSTKDPSIVKNNHEP